ncbi:hypothetical protein EDB85DRAFT_1565976 [Lactarius pseudohatsudake]|nr:hypothetical protein EDB85DRAFT_1565976 [Lactarius pseudohatsudake]
MTTKRRKVASPRSPCPSTRRWAFTHNSTNPNMVSVPAATTTCRSAKESRAEASSDSASVEVVIPLPTERARSHARAQAVSPCKKGKRRPHTPNSPRRKRRRVVDEQDQDDSDDFQIEIIVVHRGNNSAYRIPKSKSQSQPSAQPQPRHKPRRSTLQHRMSTPTAYTRLYLFTLPRPSRRRPRRSSLHQSRPDVNSLAGLPLAILPESARTEIAIPPRTEPPALVARSSRSLAQITRDTTVRDPAGFLL